VIPHLRAFVGGSQLLKTVNLKGIIFNEAEQAHAQVHSRMEKQAH
jgi:hypothetical protein